MHQIAEHSFNQYTIWLENNQQHFPVMFPTSQYKLRSERLTEQVAKLLSLI